MTAITIADISIRQDAERRYSLNDLHRAAGGENRHRPSLWAENQQAQALVTEIESEAGIPALVSVKGGASSGTFVSKELVYAYAMWISPAFHLKVIRAYDQMQTKPQRDPVEFLNDPTAMRGLLLNYSEKVIHLEGVVKEQQPKVEALDRIATANGSLCVTDAAKALQIPPRKLFDWLREHRWIYRRQGGAGWLGYQDRVMTNLLEHKVTTVQREDGMDKVIEQVRVTPKGLAKIAAELQMKVAA